MYYLDEFLASFVTDSVISLPSCLIAHEEDEVNLLLFHAPADITEFMHHSFSSADKLLDFITNMDVPNQHVTIDLKGVFESDTLLIQKRRLKIDLDAFSQLHRLGDEFALDETTIERLNESSAPDSYFQRFDSPHSDTLYETDLAPFEVQFITLKHFTKLP